MTIFSQLDVDDAALDSFKVGHHGELFNVERLTRHAEHLAKIHTISTGRVRDQLVPRLRRHEKMLVRCYDSLSLALSNGQAISPAGVWLADNFHLIDEQISIAKQHLPTKYRRELPRVKIGRFDGMPRVYLLALELIKHVDSRVDAHALKNFIEAYQRVSTLTLGELWAVPIMLRLALIETLNRVACRVMVAMEHRALASGWAKAMIEKAKDDPSKLILVVADLARSDVVLSNSFVAEFSKSLSEHALDLDFSVEIPVTWLEECLNQNGSSIQERVRLEGREQAANQVTVAAIISSLRFVEANNWQSFVEQLSVTERILRDDPAGIYPLMDFATRDSYRHAVEKIARKSRCDETMVANDAVKVAASFKAGELKFHIGYELMGAGNLKSSRAAIYFVCIALGTLATCGAGLGWLLPLSWPWSIGSGVMFAVLASALVVLSSQFVIAVTNLLVTKIFGPKLLPRMDFSRSIPPEFRTMVAIPSLLSSMGNVDHLLGGLELRFLGNRDVNLLFALLTDFSDAVTEEKAEDAVLLAAVVAGIDELNLKYKSDAYEPFYLFHRPRLWNAGEGAWIGVERKRGKLEALNTLLSNRRSGEVAVDLNFTLIHGDLSKLDDVKYVITLDTDTKLPPQSAAKLIGTMAHPLNRPILNKESSVVERGYGILQPRVEIGPHSARSSWFTDINTGEPGIDPYTRAVSDIYQDIFGEGSYIGKGIYDIDTFKCVLNGTFPDDLILSHDLIEGCFARCGLVTDVVLYEDHPASVLDDLARRRRWVRGDWQIFFWLWPFAPKKDGVWHGNPLSKLSRWKIFDNMRRSLVAPSAVLLIVSSWFAKTNPWPLEMAVVASLIIVPVMCVFFRLSYPFSYNFKMPMRILGQVLFNLVLLPSEAIANLDSIARSTARVIVTKKNLLEWRSSGFLEPERIHQRPAADSDVKKLRLRSFLRSFLIRLWFSPTLAVCCMVAMVLLHHNLDHRLFIAAPLLVLWLLAPLLASYLSRPRFEKTAVLAGDDIVFLRQLARQTWSFFETFVNAEENWLPPDNFQEFPVGIVAHRTSPTNIGLGLLSYLSAYDFGFISLEGLLDRVNNTLTTMGRLERYRGHFYNWYDTQTLTILAPNYISTVDSGNLTAHLLTLASGLRGLVNSPLINESGLVALGDTVDLALAARGEDQISSPEARTNLFDIKLALVGLQKIDHSTLPLAMTKIQQLRDEMTQIQIVEPERFWLQATLKQIDEVLLGPLTAWVAVHGSENMRINDARLLREIERLATECESLAETEYDFIFDQTRRLFSIGYYVPDHRRDVGHYDLLASEARLNSFVAIAKGGVPEEHWFLLGRQMTHGRTSTPTLLSWSGSMFEYLMPLLVMPNYNDTLLGCTCQSSVAKQIEYGHSVHVPWGISESGYNATDRDNNYQYRAFGVPGLGLKRGLSDDLVIAPYATMLAVMVDPVAATKNLRVIKELGFYGRFGLYEAVDYTPQRVPVGASNVVIKSYMSHHQGMGFVSLNNALHGQVMQRRFLARPEFQANELLMHERVPTKSSSITRKHEVASGAKLIKPVEVKPRVILTPHTPRPDVHLLSNGNYSVMVSNSGGGYSRWRQLALTRWRDDPTIDDYGLFLYLRDVVTGDTWSNAYQPTRCETSHYEAIFSSGRAEFHRRDFGIDIHTEIVVSPEDDVELRRFTVTNLSGRDRHIELTTYAEIVLAAQLADETHPAFSNLFMETEIDRPRHAIVCNRRPRSDNEDWPVLFHLFSVRDSKIDKKYGDGDISFATDRRSFVGRCRTTANPLALSDANPPQLSGNDGAALDPVVAIRWRVFLPAEGSITAHAVMGVAKTSEDSIQLLDKYGDKQLADRIFEVAWTYRQVVMKQLQVSEIDAKTYMQLSSAIIYLGPELRANPSIIAKNCRAQPSLWSYGISGDLPIVVVRIASEDEVPLAVECLRAHNYLRRMGLVFDLLIWNEDQSGYRQVIQDALTAAVAMNDGNGLLDTKGGIFVRRTEDIGDDDRILMLTIARAILTGNAGTLKQQVDRRRSRLDELPAALKALRTIEPLEVASRADHNPYGAESTPVDAALQLYNGFGGFSADGREYVMPSSSKSPYVPTPWCNVLSNPTFGCVISENGGSYTWCENAHEFRLTPWFNDVISDTTSEAIYIRDEETGEFWSPTRTGDFSETRHGFGYSTFTKTHCQISTNVNIFVAVDAPVKLTLIKIKNNSSSTRTVSVTGYCEWVLGELRSTTAAHIITEVDDTNGALLARNPYHVDFGGRIAFFDCSDATRTLTGDRSEFIGRNGQRLKPSALFRTHLSGKVGAGLDPCAAMQTVMVLAPGEERTITLLLGVGRNEDDVRTLVRRFRGQDRAQEALQEVKDFWRNLLTGVQIETPDPTVDVLVNGWLQYQIISSRLWGRSGFYQSGGAFGFRDQLQDTAALIHTQPKLMREQILRAASRQYIEGDVQHWWHPPMGRGVRTRFSDDLLWLPHATSRYVLSIGDTGILDTQILFIEGRQMKPGEEAYGDLPRVTETGVSLYDHCVKAISLALKFGEHGLPLMGCGDWNDGMNLVGQHGQGESVWLAFFLMDVLSQFSQVSIMHGDPRFAADCRMHVDRLNTAVNEHAWDGQWYLRAFFDDGTPLGGSKSTECSIDSLPQSWSVLGDGYDLERSKEAMEMAYAKLVDHSHGLIKLFAPPFDQFQPNPGYIKGYLPGIRENGGQYSHAGVWVAMALAKLRDAEKAFEIASMVNPLSHSANAEDVNRYMVEPYVVAADIYANPQHQGRGGWTWYTGAAAWLYRCYVESILGLRLANDRLYISPCVPKNWPGFKINYRYRGSRYLIECKPALKTSSEKAVNVQINGVSSIDGSILLVDDGEIRTVTVEY